MKKKGTSLVTIVLMAVILMFASSADAESTWYACSVDLTGVTGSSVFVQLSDTALTPAFTQKLFGCPVETSKEILAIALSAITNNLNVLILTDISGDGTLDSFGLIPE